MTVTAVRGDRSTDSTVGRPARRRFLPEVQALRAIAVLLVIGYHLRPDLVPGGFIGVDVFFVISGYLITGQMIREVEQTGRLRLAHFWANRARRILPAALLVILFLVATATFVLPITESGNLGRQALASVFYLQNWVLAVDSVDYSASENAATPFQHFWSLAVEEQFYLLWPLLVLLAALVASAGVRTRNGIPAIEQRVQARFRAAVLLVFALVVLASFAWSVQRVAAGDPSAYFVTTTRLWELGLGGLLAVLARDTDRWPLLRSAIALAGLAAIGVGCFTLSSDSPFPGTNALLPVLGAAAVIVAGRTRGPGSLTRLVDLAPVQWIGNVSYSLYLWHFPVAIYFVHLAGRDPSALESLGLVGVMLAAAAASYSWVEQPIRTARWARQSDPRALVAAGMAMLLVAASTAAFWITPQQQNADWQRAAVQAQQQGRDRGLFAAAAPRAGDYGPFPGRDRVMAPNPATAKTTDEFRPGTHGRCEDDPGTGGALECRFGDPHSPVLVAVLGDSHARMFTPPVLRVAEQRNWQVVTFLRNSCPYSTTPRDIPDGEDCITANRHTAERLTELRPDIVVTSAYGRSRFEGGERAAIHGYVEAWRQLTDLGAEVVVLRDAPHPRDEVVGCVAEHYEHPGACAVSRDEAMVDRHLVERAADRVDGVELLDLTDLFCGPRRCFAVLGGALVYRDDNHIGRTYAESLTPEIDRAMVGASDHA